jgi:alkyldihydroxyacetonephosphate synthase
VNVKHMKWWGWGEESVAFSHEDKPNLAAFIYKALALDVTGTAPGRPDFDSLDIPNVNLPAKLEKQLSDTVGSDNVHTDAKTRIIHTYGKSLPDLVKIRAGDLGRLPDAVVYPADEEEIANIVRVALDANAVLIPFGGGTNIAGSLEAPRDETRPVISLDLGRLDRVIEIDEHSQLARIQAGALGPSLEAQLQARGFTLGHFPDSFNHSTLGGWIATRSTGMQSDKYGDIADITKAVRVVTPNGILATRAVPSTSTGPSVREMILGSEGRLGVITEATVHVHRNPEKRTILGYLFPDWSTGLRAMRDISASDAAPSVTRVSDANETQFSFATRKEGKKLDHFVSSLMQKYLDKRKHFDLENMCLSFIGYEGTAENVKYQKKLVGEIVSRYNGICIGRSPGQLYDQKKFDTPYIRDFLLDRGGLADVSETATSWSHLEPLYDGVVTAANKAFAEIGVQGWIMCHMSHSYHSGACLYFTFAFKAKEDEDELTQYQVVKSAIQQAFIDFNGTVSHHHSVGLEHKQWLSDDISTPGIQMIEALFDGIDPGHNLNPGKIV